MTRQTYLAAIKAEKSGPLFIRLRRKMKTTTIIKRSGLQKTVWTGLFPKFVQQSIYLSTVNIFLSITAILGNSPILVALHRESSLHPSSKLLYRCICCPAVGAEIQRDCNFEAHLYPWSYRLDWCLDASLTTIFDQRITAFYGAGWTLIPLSLLISLASFTKIFRTLRHLQAQVQDRIQQQLSQPHALNMARYGKAVHSGYSQF